MTKQNMQNDVRTLGNDQKIYKIENLNIDDLRHASTTNNSLVLKFTKFHYVGKNTCLEIKVLDYGGLLESLTVNLDKENT
jgi:hypothetical protein